MQLQRHGWDIHIVCFGTADAGVTGVGFRSRSARVPVRLAPTQARLPRKLTIIGAHVTNGDCGGVAANRYCRARKPRAPRRPRTNRAPRTNCAPRPATMRAAPTPNLVRARALAAAQQATQRVQARLGVMLTRPRIQGATLGEVIAAGRTRSGALGQV